MVSMFSMQKISSNSQTKSIKVKAQHLLRMLRQQSNSRCELLLSELWISCYQASLIYYQTRQNVSLSSEKNGAGKSTIIKLLARFYDVTSGEILVNGVNIKEVNLSSYYKLWGSSFNTSLDTGFRTRKYRSQISISSMTVNVSKSHRKRWCTRTHRWITKKENTMLSTDFPQGRSLRWRMAEDRYRSWYVCWTTSHRPRWTDECTRCTSRSSCFWAYSYGCWRCDNAHGLS